MVLFKPEIGQDFHIIGARKGPSFMNAKGEKKLT
jgi:hypothetical protein